MPDDKHDKFMSDGGPEYNEGDLDKINALRTAKTRPDFYGIPILTEADVLFVTAASRQHRPNWCGNCVMMNSQDSTCMVYSPNIKIQTFVIEPQKFWPVCGKHEFGEPHKGEPMRMAESDPDAGGLIWVNTPNDGREEGGTTCGGLNNGDDCDYYSVPGEDKRDFDMGECRVLQKDVEGGACCSAWQDDDLLTWAEAQEHIAASPYAQAKEGLVQSGEKKPRSR